MKDKIYIKSSSNKLAKFLILVLILTCCIYILGSYTSVVAIDIGSNSAVSSLQKRMEKSSIVEGEILVKFKDSEKYNFSNKRESAEAESISFGRNNSLQFVRGSLSTNIANFKTSKDESMEETINRIKNIQEVESVQPNYSYYANYTLNDPFYTNGNLWGLNQGSDADIDLPEAYDTANMAAAQDVIVAVIDTGVKYDHEDLSANMWDGSSCKDWNGNAITGGCTHGYDFEDYDTNPMVVSTDPSAAHGTHVAGTIAATHNNSKGIIGVYSKAKIMALRVKEPFQTLPLVDAINFAKQNGAKVINASWGGYAPAEDLALDNAIKDFPGLFVAAAGNDAVNNDDGLWPFYPCALTHDNVICVAATDSNDNLASFSNYGTTSVDIAAPGVSIQSTVTGSTSAYSPMSGTSMATPHVSGAVAYMYGLKTDIVSQEVRNFLFSVADSNSSLNGRTVTGKRLNLNNTIRGVDALSDPVVSTQYFTWADDNNDNKKVWVLVGNPSINTAYSNIKVDDSFDSSYPILPTDKTTPRLANVTDGPVKVSSSQNVYATQRILYSGSFNEYAAIPEGELANKYYFTWTDDNDDTKKAWVLIGNPSESQTANITIKVGDRTPISQSISPGGRYTRKLTDIKDGPIEVSSDINVYASQRVLYQGSFNEYAGIPADHLTNKYYFTWADDNNNNKKTWVLVGNPSESQAANITIKVRDQPSSVKTIPPGGRYTTRIPNIQDGPIVVSSDINVYSTQRVLFDGSFNEYAGIPADQLTNRYYFTWADDNGITKKTWLLVGNPSESQTANITIKVGDNSPSAHSIAPGSRFTTKLTGIQDGPIIVSSDINVYSTQRVLYNGSFNEYPGIINP